MQWKSGLQKGVEIEVVSEPSLEHAVQRDNDRLGRTVSLIGFAPGSLMKETIPCRQRGHAMEPGGPGFAVDVLLVEQRYKAQLVQNSCPQPVHENHLR